MRILRIIIFSVLILNLLTFSALAAQAINPTPVTDTITGEVYYKYLPTPTGLGTFEADDITNYPYEIYLPNEIDPASYRIHSNYTKNTDACASCHATHTAVGPSLLQWSTVYDTCIACHDGTVTTTYNVKLGQIANYFVDDMYMVPTYGGNFAVLDDADMVNSKNGSVHMVKPLTVSISGAPGGSAVGETIELDNGKSVTMWDQEFGCEDCHSPHGQGGNARILHPDPNGWASKQAKAVENLYEVETVAGAAYVLNNGTRATLIKGFPYKVSVQNISNGTVYDITYKFDIDNLGDSMYGSYTTIKPKATYPNALSEITNVYGTAAISVRMAIYNYLKADEKVLHLSGLNSFCGTCHVDYNTEDEVLEGNGADSIMGLKEKRPGYGNPNGVYSRAHRHAVGVTWNFGGFADKDYIGPDKIMKTMGFTESDQTISCLTCHFAHGTDTIMWESWINKFNNNAAMYNDTFGLFDSWMPDPMTFEPSPMLMENAGAGSDLKRLPNMATCEACHQKGQGAEGYNANTGQYQDGYTPVPSNY